MFTRLRGVTTIRGYNVFNAHLFELLSDLSRRAFTVFICNHDYCTTALARSRVLILNEGGEMNDTERRGVNLFVHKHDLECVWVDDTHHSHHSRLMRTLARVIVV